MLKRLCITAGLVLAASTPSVQRAAPTAPDPRMDVAAPGAAESPAGGTAPLPDPSRAAPAEPEEPVRAPDLVRWRSIPAGEDESRETLRPVLYFFTADWCPPCAALKRTVFSDPVVAELIEESYVPVAVNDVRDENQLSLPEIDSLKLKFLVGRLPSLVVSRPDGGPAVSEVGVPVYSKMFRFLQTAGERLDQLERDYGSGQPAETTTD